MKLAKPDHEEILKYQACGDEFGAVTGFLDFLKNWNIQAAYVPSNYKRGSVALVQPERLERLVFDYFGIDKAKLDAQLAEAQSYENAMEKGRTDDQTD
jgi:hypothetical protein